MSPRPDTEPASRQTRILLIDDHPIVRQGLAQLFAAERNLAICGQAASGTEALALAAQTGPDLIVTDLSLREGSGIDLIRELAARHPTIPMLVLSMHEEQLYAERALRAGARGYVMKHEAPALILVAVRRVRAGEVFLSEAMAARLLHRFVAARTAPEASPLSKLTDREMEVFHLIGRGLATRQIADALKLSPKTVETHREHIKQKLGLSGAAELLHFAIQHDMEKSSA